MSQDPHGDAGEEHRKNDRKSGDRAADVNDQKLGPSHLRGDRDHAGQRQRDHGRRAVGRAGRGFLGDVHRRPAIAITAPGERKCKGCNGQVDRGRQIDRSIESQRRDDPQPRQGRAQDGSQRVEAVKPADLAPGMAAAVFQQCGGDGKCGAHGGGRYDQQSQAECCLQQEAGPEGRRQCEDPVEVQQDRKQDEGREADADLEQGIGGDP